MNHLRSHSFRLALLYLSLFSISVLVIFGVIYWATAGYMASTLDLSVEAEMAALLNLHRRGGQSALIQAIRDHGQAPEGRSTYELLLDPSGEKLAGNLSPLAPRTGWQNLPLPEAGDDGDEGDPMRAKGVLLSDGSFLLVGQ